MKDINSIHYDYYLTTDFRVNYPLRISPYSNRDMSYYCIDRNCWVSCFSHENDHGNLEYLGHNLSDEEVVEKFNKIKVTIELEK